MSDLRKIAIELIRHRPDARRREDAALNALEESIAANGLLQPIVVRLVGGGEFEVVAGSHRLQAVELLDWPAIDAIVVDLDDLHAEAAMIDENLIRAELSPTERAEAVARSKQLYLLLHPETQNGGDCRSGEFSVRNVCDLEKSKESNSSIPAASCDDMKSTAVRFTADKASQWGKSERSVQLDVERIEKTAPEVRAAIKGTHLDTGKFLDEVKKLPQAEQVAYAERRLDDPVQPRPQGWIGGRYAAANTAPEGALFERFLKAASWFDDLNTTSLLASAGRQRAVCCQRARGIVDKLEAMLEEVDR